MTRFDLEMDGEMEASDDGRWVRYHDHMDALAKKDREIAELKSEIHEWEITDLGSSQIANTEEIRRLRLQLDEKDTELGKQDAELIVLRAAYHQLMEQAVGLAETVLQGHRHRLKTLRIVRASASIVLAEKLMRSPEVQAWKEKE